MSPRHDRLPGSTREPGKLAVALRRRKKSLAYVGAALAVAGVGSATVATATAGAATPSRVAARPANAAHIAAQPAPEARPAARRAPRAPQHVAAPHSVATAKAVKHAVPAAHTAAPASVPASKPTHAPASKPPSKPASKPASQPAHALASKPASAPASKPASAPASTPASQPAPPTWPQVLNDVNQQTNPAAARLGQLPLADRLLPVATSGAQSWMPISPAQLGNATTIVQQALDKRMGVRSAVIAVATAMQESQLLNLNYGSQDSLGLFQQRPSMGWGTAAQVTDPAYAADAFLTALQQHQAGDPGWAAQPLWANAQAVQNSGFPFAYAKWESQAAGLVKQILMSLH